MNKTLFILIIAISCYGCNSETAPRESNPVRKDTIAKILTTTDIRKQKPTMEGYHELAQQLPDSVNLRVILNNEQLVRCWMIYYDRVERHWSTLSWGGKGKDNMVLVDTVFNQSVGIDDNISDPPTFYMATSIDRGKSWESFDMSPVTLDCVGDPPRRKAQAALLIVSNDFPRWKRPSLTMAWQSKYDVSATSWLLAASWDFSALCSGLKELRKKRQ
jgi:hypothetical protein